MCRIIVQCNNQHCLTQRRCTTSTNRNQLPNWGRQSTKIRSRTWTRSSIRRQKQGIIIKSRNQNNYFRRLCQWPKVNWCHSILEQRINKWKLTGQLDRLAQRKLRRWCRLRMFWGCRQKDRRASRDAQRDQPNSRPCV